MTALFVVSTLLLQVLIPYHRYVFFLKWLTLSLLAYAAVLFTVQVPWSEVALRTIWPHLSLNAEAAAVVVGKRGTAAVNFIEMRAVLVPSALRAHDEKIARDPKVLDERLAEWRKAGLRIGFTNGCFDLIHPGHLKVLAGARAACDRLVVGLNSDASTRRLKGPSRPIQDEVARAEVLAALEATDLVVIFEEDTPLELIRRVKPQVLVKGGDYTREQVVGHEIVEAAGGEIVIVETLPERSTTRLVERSKKPA